MRNNPLDVIGQLRRCIPIGPAWLPRQGATGLAFATAVMIASGLSMSLTIGAVGAADGQAQAQARRTLCVHGLAEGQNLDVRAGPSATARVVGGLASGTCDIRRTGACKGAWCVMSQGKTSGWVDTNHIGVYEFPAAATPATEPQAQPKPEQVATPAPVPPSSPRAVAEPRRPPVAAARTSRSARAPDVRASRACVVGVASWDTLRMRAGPGVSHAALGSIPPRACDVRHAGPCQRGWCRVAWRGRVGWVNANYLD